MRSPACTWTGECLLSASDSSKWHAKSGKGRMKSPAHMRRTYIIRKHKEYVHGKSGQSKVLHISADRRCRKSCFLQSRSRPRELSPPPAHSLAASLYRLMQPAAGETNWKPIPPKDPSLIPGIPVLSPGDFHLTIVAGGGAV